jgi:hypothetical protein
MLAHREMSGHHMISVIEYARGRRVRLSRVLSTASARTVNQASSPKFGDAPSPSWRRVWVVVNIDARDIPHPDQVGFWREKHIMEGGPR